MKQPWIYITFVVLPTQVAVVVKNPPADAGDPRDESFIPGSGRSLEEGMATHASILAWRIRQTEEPGGPQSVGSQRVGHDWSNLAHTLLWRALERQFKLLIHLLPKKEQRPETNIFCSHPFARCGTQNHHWYQSTLKSAFPEGSIQETSVLWQRPC